MNVLFITSRDTDQLLKFDLATNSVVATAETGDEPWDVLVIEERNEIYVSNFMGNSVWVYNAETLAVKQKIAVGPNPALMEYLPKIGIVAVVVRGVNGVAMVNVNNYTVSSFQSADGKGAYGIAADPENNWVLATNRDTGNARILYWDSGSWFKGIELKFGERSVPFEAAYNPANQKLYVVYENNGWYMDILQVESVNRMPKLATVQLGSSGDSKHPDVGGTGLAVNPVTGNVWNANTFDNTVSVISGVTNQLIQTLSTGDDPYEIAIHPETGTAYVTLRRANAIDKLPDIY
jgi:YVTN family beta-propeller protein